MWRSYDSSAVTGRVTHARHAPGSYRFDAMSNDGDLRMRLDAQIAVRRAKHARSRPSPTAESNGTGHHRSTPGETLTRVLIQVVIILAAAGLFAFGLRTFVVQPFWIPSQSMEPTLHGCPTCDPDRLLVDKLSYRLHAVHRGDVVVFSRPPRAPTTDADLVKRVIGLPGDMLRATNGVVYVDNRALKEPYIPADCDGTRDFGPLLVPPGDVFVMGDNRCDSLDSRVFGPISESSIVGRAFVIVWPLPRIHWL
jgi:signal peptidase I